jgi:sulfur-carrier protein
VIACEYPDLGEKLINESGQIYNHNHILINGRDVLSLSTKLETRLREEDLIDIFPPIGGGYL